MPLSIADRALLGPIYKQNESKIILDYLNHIFFRNVSKSGNNEKFYSTLYNSDITFTTVQRVKECWKYFQWALPEEIPLHDFQKSSAAAKQLGERGTKYLNDRQFDKAFRAFTLALLFAPAESDEMCLAYANRSLIFLETRSYKNSVEEIGLSTSCTGCPEELRIQPNLRLNKKLKENSDLVTDTKIWEYRDNVIFKTQTPANNLVKIVENPERGRELVSNVDAKAGTVFFIENPYLAVLKDELNWDVSHCHYCLDKTSSCYPCNNCIFAMYCSEKCRNAAFKEYHQYECQSLAIFHLLAEPRYAILAFRTICKLGPENAYKLYKNEASATQEITEYLQIFNLISHAETHDDIEKFSAVMQAMILSNCLLKFSNFFDEHQTDKKFAIWITSQILHHVENIPYNSIALDEMKTKLPKSEPVSSETIRKLELEQIATGVYANVSLLNHSCDPNVTRFNTTGGKLSIVALRTISSGESLFTSYTKCFLTNSVEERQVYLKSTYNFICKCKPCIENWPQLEKLMAQKIPKLTGNNKKAFDAKCKGFSDAYDLVLQNKPLDAVELIVPVITFFYASTEPPFSKVYLSQDVLKRALDLIVYLSS